MSERASRSPISPERGRRKKSVVDRGRQRFNKILTGLGLITVLGLGGVVGVYTYFHNNNQEVIAVTDQVGINSLVNQEIQRLEIEKNQQEIDLWNSVDIEIKQNIENQTLTPAKKLNIVTKNMLNSSNPYFKDAAQFILDQYNIRRIDTTIVPTLSDQSLLESHIEVNNGNLGIGLAASGSAMMSSDPVAIAWYLVHEKEHIKNSFKSDESIADKSLKERVEYQRQRILNREEFLAEEARGYMRQAQAIIYHLGLTENPDQYASRMTGMLKTENADLVVNAINYQGNSSIF